MPEPLGAALRIVFPELIGESSKRSISSVSKRDRVSNAKTTCLVVGARFAVREDGEKAFVERIYLIHVEAFDWNCPQHITPRFTEDQIRTILAPFEARLQAMEAENARLHAQLAARNEGDPTGS